MSSKITIKAQKDHVLHRTALLRFFGKERGEFKNPAGYRTPLTTYADIREISGYWDGEYQRARKSKPWHKDPAQKLWENAKSKIARELRDADETKTYPYNDWFWNHVLLKLSIYLEVAKTTPSPTDLLIESFQETIGDRIKDASEFIHDAGNLAGDVGKVAKDAADAIAEAGERAWSGIKIAAIVGGSLLGAAIVVPPVVRAIRKTRTNTTTNEQGD